MKSLTKMLFSTTILDMVSVSNNQVVSSIRYVIIYYSFYSLCTAAPVLKKIGQGRLYTGYSF